MKFIIRKHSEPGFEQMCVASTVEDFKAIQYLYGGPLVIDFKAGIIWIFKKEKDKKKFLETP